MKPLFRLLKSRRPVIFTMLILSMAGCATSGITSSQSDILTGATGMTIYTFDLDSPGNGESACKGSCIKLWPPVSPRDRVSSEGFDTITRDEGIQQLAYRGKPVYYYAKDQKPGDAKGDGIGNVWHIVPRESKPSIKYSGGYDYY